MNETECQTYLTSLCDEYHIPTELRPKLKFRETLEKGKVLAYFNDQSNTITLALDFLHECDENLFRNNGQLTASGKNGYLVVREVIRHEFGHFLQKIKGSPKRRFAEAEARLFAKRKLYEIFYPYKPERAKQTKIIEFLEVSLHE